MKACTQCGRCCTNADFMGSMEATEDDVTRWVKHRRYDILRFVDLVRPDGAFICADLWVDNQTGNDRKRCPFVRKVRSQDRYTCTIYETRPEVCREFPHHVSQMEFVNCEMLERGDTDADVDVFMGRPPRTKDTVAKKP